MYLSGDCHMWIFTLYRGVQLGLPSGQLHEGFLRQKALEIRARCGNSRGRLFRGVLIQLLSRIVSLDVWLSGSHKNIVHVATPRQHKAGL